LTELRKVTRLRKVSRLRQIGNVTLSVKVHPWVPHRWRSKFGTGALIHASC
jgi:hypothetical protein